MSAEFFSKLSQNYIELLKDDEYYDITIEVGEDLNVKIFRAHMNILCYRSPYLRRELASNKKKNNDNVLAHIELPNISPEIFQVILEYIYGGVLSLNGQDTSEFFKVLAAADKLYLQELVNYLQKYLIEYKTEWIEQHFEFTQQISSQSKNLLELQEFCTNLIVQSPKKILNSLNLTSLSEKSLVQLIKRDDLQMKEIEVWEHVIKWGVAQNPTLILDPNTWSDDDFKKMKNTLQNCLPLIRFFCLSSSKEFLQNVRPYKKLLDQQLHEDLVDYYLDPDRLLRDNISRPRKMKINEIDKVIDSQIVDSSIISTISKWIDKIVINNDNFKELYLPYKFELLLRGSRDGFTPKKFHELCDNKPNTITFIKVKGTEEIIGGYNPLKWESKGNWVNTKDSFIFSFKNKNIKNAIISNVKNTNCALFFASNFGPYFGSDITIFSSSGSIDYNNFYYRKYCYEKLIRDAEGEFSIDDYEDDEYYDITIEVGEDPNVKIFRAHMNILCYRSPYLRRTLNSNKKSNDGVLVHIRLPNISPEIFQIILRYIYGGILSLDGQGSSNILNVLLAADMLHLQELVVYLQKYLIENESEWMEENFEFTQRISLQSNNLLELQQFCTNFIAKSPEKLFKSLYFTSLSEEFLISLLKRDDLQMREVEIWEYVLKWGLAQNPTLVTDPDTWSDADFKTMENTLQHCLPLIRFYCLSSVEFSRKVHPYQKLLKRQLYKDLLNSYLDPNSVSTDNILLPRNIRNDGMIESKIVNLSIVSAISRQIDKLDFNDNSKFAHIRGLYLPYKFKLLLRGSRDGFTPKKFHTLCDNIPNTVTFMKIKGVEEIIGGYNPIIWEPSFQKYGKTKDSFIFSFKNKNVKDAIISNVEITDYALFYKPIFGPYFGNDIIIWASSESTDYNTIFCKKWFYEKMIRDTKDTFSIEDYEVFQLIRR
ncbi:hypothetical protein C1645_812023 [Glomus cerebriforme]|uniref:Kelch-like protein 17 n=1 Tax=Glomus cerebriforme TaxID=658196 RepID=A0A397TVZ6_9GLOM|nr:hypothetical protein C1645_812023 [Glomus cerebriforme]